MNDATGGAPRWNFYFTVDEIQAAKARVEAAGGRVVNGPHEVPGGAWVLQGVDPQGSAFQLTAAAASA
jgi:predicted enzyme related to lactoylglutathione lyase